MRRRDAIVGLVAAGFSPRVAFAFADPAERRLENRVQLWHDYARKTENLVARATTTRETSLLEEPLVTTGALVFLAPATLVLRDDGLSGSTTIIDPDGTRIFANGETPPAATPRGREPARDWVADRMLRLFAPAEASALTEGCRTDVPRGGAYRLDLLPPKGSTVRRLVRSFGIELDPVVGAVVEITIAEAQGDRVVLGLHDHRQNLAAEDLEPHLRAVADDLPSLRR